MASWSVCRMVGMHCWRRRKEAPSSMSLLVHVLTESHDLMILWGVGGTVLVWGKVCGTSMLVIAIRHVGHGEGHSVFVLLIIVSI